MSGPTWTDYRREVFGDPFLVWHDGADFTEITRRYVEDPRLALRMITAGVVEGDPVAAQAPAYLTPDDEQRAELVAMLEGALDTATGPARTEIAASLHALGGSPDLADVVVAELRSDQHWGVRIDAAMRLAAFAPTPELVAAVADGVRESDYLVRYHCAETLLRWAGRPADISLDPDLFPLLADDHGREGWAEVAERLTAGVTP